MAVEIGEHLTIEDVVHVARERAAVALSSRARDRVARSRELVDRLVGEGTPVYAITTGVGELAGERISAQQSAQLQVNIIRSHSAGVGDPLSEEVVRGMMVLRAHALALGFSGIQTQTLDLLVEMLNRGLHPIIPSQGSVGASGDLAPLAHLALAMIGEGEVLAGGRRRPSADALAAAELRPAALSGKDGLALINGTQLMTGIGALALYDARRLAGTADAAAAMSFEALRGNPDAVDPLLHDARPHPGQRAAAANLRRMIEGSEILARPGERRKLQDAYALRCIPQVHGAVRDALAYVKSVIDIEINSATDNPLLFPEQGRVISGGNFHGQPVALALDVLAMAISELANIAERRIERLVNPHLSGLPPFLTSEHGLHSGLMLAQYTAAALVSENKVLAHPASVDSIPTSANQEDHVSMGTIAARKAARVIEHAQQVCGIELICAAQALEFHRPQQPGVGTRAALAAVREVIPPLAADRVLAPDFAAGLDLVRSGAILAAVTASVGDLA